MKTTVEIPDPILSQAKKVAAREGTTVRALIEEGLRRVLVERSRAGEFRLRKATFKGKGLQPGLREGDWERIRDAAYEVSELWTADRDFGRFPGVKVRNPLVG